MENADRFIVAFNKIEKFFDKEIDDKKYVPFYRAVQRLLHTNPIVRRYKDDLLEYSELRNAIIHERTETHYAIAEPHEQIVIQIEKIAQELTAPKRVIPAFSKKLYILDGKDSLVSVLHIIKQTSYSQFPIYRNNQFVGLLTDKGITQWLAKNIDSTFSQLLDTQILDIIKGDHHDKNYLFINQSMTIYEAEDIYLKQIKQNKRLDALLITKNGKQTEQLLGMVTTNDLIHIP
ncbi:CBS domain protein [Paraliobacillus sp. PM-2]|uniref:CBS domain-containing protein n=1 Tax=Paraliobacillus sp. PM-2 TaxID=1462524 RepID=UPI00061BF8D9|nr:CBS domain-containing protein [Paraliobacillus sp. PM-2]CQR47938.1 CBS domain protein [Paraliobacillus sp. PM-2]